jgi:hypothetical protein
MAKPKFHPKCRPSRNALGVNPCIRPYAYALCGFEDGHAADHHAEPPIRYRAKLWRLDLRGKWRVDNGEPGLAFIGACRMWRNRCESVDHIVWVASCKCTDAQCPRWKALEYAREKLGLESIRIDERPRARPRT